MTQERALSVVSAERDELEGRDPRSLVRRAGLPDDRRAQTAVGHVAWILLVVAMAAAGSWRLGRPALWADELATWGIQRLDARDLRLLRHTDVALAPYYILLHG